MDEAPWGPEPGGPPAAPLGRYALGVLVTVLAIVSQYFVPQMFPFTDVLYGNLPGDLFVVYGIPVITFALLVGGTPLRNWGRRMGLASFHGLRFYGLLTLLSLLVLFVLLIVYEFVDPGAVQLLSRPNPALQQAVGNPWFFVGFSFVIGAFEETIFRGYIFGYWRDRAGYWLVPAVWTSVLFAGVHLYYGTTYGPAAPLIFPSLFFLGVALAATYKFSGGNLVVPAALHGFHDAAAFLSLVSYEWMVIGEVLEYAVVFVGALLGLYYYLKSEPRAPASPGPPDSPFPSVGR